MQNYILIITIVFALLSACDKSDKDIEEICDGRVLSEFSTHIYRKLLAAYNNSCNVCLKEILDNWNERSEPVDQSKLTNDTVINVYKIYKEFYTPWDIERVGGSEWGTDIYKNYSYYVIQNAIVYNFGYYIYDLNTDTLKDFRPIIANDSKKLLYLTKDYCDAIKCFLG